MPTDNRIARCERTVGSLMPSRSAASFPPNPWASAVRRDRRMQLPQDQTIANEHAKLFPEHSFAYVLDPIEPRVKTKGRAKCPDRTPTKIWIVAHRVVGFQPYPELLSSGFLSLTPLSPPLDFLATLEPMTEIRASAPFAARRISLRVHPVRRCVPYRKSRRDLTPLGQSASHG